MSTFDLFTTFVHLDSRDGAHAVPVTDTFWPELMAGERVYDGRMITASHISGDVDHWERHPAGGEVLLLLSGAVDVVLDQPEGERRVPLDAGRAFIERYRPAFSVVAGNDAVAAAFGKVARIPTVLVFDRDGASSLHFIHVRDSGVTNPKPEEVIAAVQGAL